MHLKKDLKNSKTDLGSQILDHTSAVGSNLWFLLSNRISQRSAVGMDIGSDLTLELSQANKTGQMWYLRNHLHITPSSRGYMLAQYPFVSKLEDELSATGNSKRRYRGVLAWQRTKRDPKLLPVRDITLNNVSHVSWSDTCDIKALCSFWLENYPANIRL